MITRSLYCLLFILLCSCTNKKDENTSFQIIPLIGMKGHVEKVSIETLGKIRLIPLETRDDILIKSILSLIEKNDLFIIGHDNKCSIFDQNGKYLCNVGQRGEGPHEYTYLSNLWITDDYIFLVDGGKKKIQCFSYEGLFQKEISFPASYSEVQPLSGNKILGFYPRLHGTEEIKFDIFDETGVLRSIPNEKLYKEGNFVSMYYNETTAYSYQNDYCFIEMFSDTIFTVHEDKDMQARFFFDLGDYRPDIEKRYTETNPRANIWANMMHVHPIGETISYLFFEVSKNEGLFYWDKKASRLHHALFTVPESIQTEDENFKIISVSADNRKVLGWVNPETDDNPIIVQIEVEE